MKKNLGRYMIPLNYDFASEAQIAMDYDTNNLMVTVWSGDTKWQGNCLLNNTSQDLSWVYNKSLKVDDIELKLLTESNLRLAHFQRSIVIEYFNMDYYRKVFGKVDIKNSPF